MRGEDDGGNAGGCLPVFLRLPGLRRGPAPEARGLLRLVFLGDGALSSRPAGDRLLRMTLSQRINLALKPVPAWPLYIIGVLPPAWFLWLGLTGGLGIEPIAELEHRLGKLALQVFIATLAVTPLRTWTGVNLVKFRRAAGLLVFFYVSLHLLVWLVLDVQALSRIWADILKRPYITVGMLAFALLIPVAATSNNLSIRKLGPKRWKRLHWLTYPAAALGALHFVMLAKGFRIEPLVYLTLVLLLLATRVGLPLKRRVA